MAHTIELTDTVDEAVRNAIVRPLVAYNALQTGISDFRPLVLALKDDQGEVVGGLWGRTGYSWLYVELLVVPESLRGRRIGTELLARAEAEARARGCQGAWLDTFEFQARGFYERLGYRCFGELNEYPPGFASYFMTKVL